MTNPAVHGHPVIHGSVEDHLELAPVGIAVTAGPKHKLLYANGVFRALLAAGEITVGHNGGGPRMAADLTPLLDRAFEHTQGLSDEIVAPAGTSPAKWTCTVWRVRDAHGSPEELVIEVRDISQSEGARTRQRAITERLLLGALHDQDAARDAEEESRRAVHLADFSRKLSISLDEAETRDTIRHLTLPRRGTWCIVDVVESNGAVRRLPPIHPDPVKQALADRLAIPSPDSAGVPGGTRSILASIQPMILTPEADRALTLIAGGEESLRTLREIGFGALLVVPLVVHAKVEGVLTFVSPKGEHSFSVEEVALASDLASRCALALENARLYREAETLRLAADLANESKSEFLRSMSHELRTPLNAIGGFVELIDMGISGPVTEKQHEALGRIKANQNLLLTLITDVLSFSRIDSGRVEYQMKEISLRRALADVAEMLSGAITDKGLRREGPRPDVDATAWADADRVRQIIVNLVMNAVKYTPKGGTITLECGGDGNQSFVRISDNGPGIPAAKLERIFEPFVQLTTGLADRHGGVGLGLTISRDLARGMGGDLEAKSSVGVGSRFTLVLPSRAPGSLHGSQPQAPASSVPPKE
jgi:signal transduction histidine kinase